MKNRLTFNLVVLMVTFIGTAVVSIILFALFKRTEENVYNIAMRIFLCVGICLFVSRGLGFYFLIHAHRKREEQNEKINTNKATNGTDRIH